MQGGEEADRKQSEGSKARGGPWDGGEEDLMMLQCAGEGS